jgi:hypothetical protein
MTRARGRWTALACLALAACSSSSAPRQNGATGSAGASGGAGTNGTAGTGSVPACQVNIVPISPASFDNLQAGPTSVMRVRGDVTGAVAALYDWAWSVSLADGTPVAVKRVGDASLVEFTMADVGTYTIAASLTGSMCSGLRTITAARAGAKIGTYRLRVTPPSTDLVPAQDLVRQVAGGTPSGGNVLALSPGIVVGFDVARASDGSALPSYVRLTEASTGAILELRTSKDGPNTLRIADGTYGTVVIPDGGDVAPVTFPPRPAAAIGAGPLALDDGATIGGAVLDDAGKPIAGATVVLRADALVSTMGTTDATGAFQVRARAGTFGVTVVSPLAAGNLESKLAAAGGLVVDEAAPPAPLTIRIQPGALATGSVALRAAEAASLGDGARITLAAAAPLAGIGTLAVGGDAPRALAGDVRFSLHAGADGTVSTGGVPRGSYRLTVFPATATTGDAVTATTLDLSAGSAGPVPLVLASKVMLKGKLLPAMEAAGVKLIALDDGGLPIVAQADADETGSFALAVSPQRSYFLRALPRPDQALARASFPVVTVGNAALVVQDRSMPPAVLFAGRVVDPSVQGVGSALVQAFCVTTAPGCADPTVPVAETVTRSDGTFQLMLPDPDGTP